MSDASLSSPQHRARTLRSASNVRHPRAPPSSSRGCTRGPSEPHTVPIQRTPPATLPHRNETKRNEIRRRRRTRARTKKARHRRWRAPPRPWALRQPLDVRHAEQTNKQTGKHRGRATIRRGLSLPTPLPLHGAVPPRADAAGKEASACPPACGRSTPWPRPSSSSPPRPVRRVHRLPPAPPPAPSPC